MLVIDLLTLNHFLYFLNPALESEYLINGKTARLRDIQDLFLGTGLGPESYANHRARSHRANP